MKTLTITVEVEDHRAARLLNEVDMAARNGEGLTIRTAGDTFTVEALHVTGKV